MVGTGHDFLKRACRFELPVRCPRHVSRLYPRHEWIAPRLNKDLLNPRPAKSPARKGGASRG